MSIIKKPFTKTDEGKEIDLYILENSKGTKLSVITYGLRILSLFTADKNGNFSDVVLGYDDFNSYKGADYQGAFVGRYANRIGNASFKIDGNTYTLTKNDGENSLHGGPLGMHQVVWDVESISDTDEPSITFTHTSSDMEEGYPGNLEMKVVYTLTNENEVKFDYFAVSDKKTVFNPTNHSFFNLSGDAENLVLDTWLKINATNTTAVSDNLIPTGEIKSVKGTALDFSNGKLLGDDMFSCEKAVAMCGGFDHNFCVDGSGLRLHATAYHKESGRQMEVYSDMPGVQLYTFNKTGDPVGKYGKIYKNHSAFCLETQFYPDSPNKENFLFKYVLPNETFHSTTVYKFSVKEDI